MPKRGNLSKQLGETRYTTQEVVQVQPDPIKAATDTLQQQGGTQEEKPARTHARKPATARKDVDIPMLYEQIQQRKHLSNGSFRYQSGELEEMDAIFSELEKRKPGRISKNDLARMAMITLCQDYRDNGQESILAQVFERM